MSIGMNTWFGMESAGLLDGGGLTLGDDITVNIDLAFVYKEEKPAEESN